MNKKVAISMILAVVLGGVGFWCWDAFEREVSVVRIGGQKFEVEKAETAKERALGLGGRKSLCQECAMLFIFPEKGIHSFWMKEMNFPLDIVWFDSTDGKIRYIEKSIPADSQEIYSPLTESDRVLELNGGWVERLEMQAGDEILLEK